MLIDTLSARGPLFFYSPPAVESQSCRPSQDNICSCASNKTKGRHKEEKHSNGRNSWLCNASLKANLDFSESQQEHCSTRTSQNEHLSIKSTSSCAFLLITFETVIYFPPASRSTSLVIPRTNRPLLGSQCFKHSWISVGTARSPTARIRNSRNLSACVENLRSNLFSLIPYWVMSPFLSLHTSADDLMPYSCFASFCLLLFLVFSLQSFLIGC